MLLGFLSTDEEPELPSGLKLQRAVLLGEDMELLEHPVVQTMLGLALLMWVIGFNQVDSDDI